MTSKNYNYDDHDEAENDSSDTIDQQFLLAPSSTNSTNRNPTSITEKVVAPAVVQQQQQPQQNDGGLDKNLTIRTSLRRRQYHNEVEDEGEEQQEEQHYNWIRAYWLGFSLFLILFAFWLLDTLKDPIFGILVNGNLEQHQPFAKLFSVGTTLLLVSYMEYISHHYDDSDAKHIDHQHHEHQYYYNYDKTSTTPPPKVHRTNEDVLDPGGKWDRMPLGTYSQEDRSCRLRRDENISENTTTIFQNVCLPYCIFFAIMASILQFNPMVALADTTSSVSPKNDIPGNRSRRQQQGNNSTTSTSTTTYYYYWYIVGYIFFAGIESFGSLAVASFWSYTNSTLSVVEAERFYGVIIAIAQLGAITGSTMVTTHIWTSITLIILSCLIILLHILIIRAYDKRFGRRISSASSSTNDRNAEWNSVHKNNDNNIRMFNQHQEPASSSSSLWLGIHLILKYNYVIFILGASCLYEISLTCLNYQMTLLGWSHFTESERKSSFKQFMGHYGQLVNISSLIMSWMIFPRLIRQLGVRYTIRLFPTLLLLVNILAFTAIPGNLWVLFLSLSILKAMTYSIHDPAKEILYIPTAHSIKFRSKFWIDVVGARLAKAIGSSINRYAGSVDRSIQVASAPSLLTAMALWWVCYRVGILFDHLVATHTVVGVDHPDDESAPPQRMSQYVDDMLYSSELIEFHDAADNRENSP